MGGKLSKTIKELESGRPCAVDLSHRELTNADLARLCEHLKSNRTCHTLHLKGNWIRGSEPPGVQPLGDALMLHRHLKRLYVSHNALRDEGALVLADAFKRSNTLGMIDLSSCEIGVKGAVAIGKALSLNRSLHTLYLSHNEVGPQGAAALAEGLADNARLKVLDISSNRIADDGAVALGRMFRPSSKSTGGAVGNRTLEQLFLIRNGITERGARALAEGLTVQQREEGQKEQGEEDSSKASSSDVPALRSLNLDYNEITDRGAQAFMQVLASNNIIQKISFDDKSVSAQWQREFQSRMQRRQREAQERAREQQ